MRRIYICGIFTHESRKFSVYTSQATKQHTLMLLSACERNDLRKELRVGRKDLLQRICCLSTAHQICRHEAARPALQETTAPRGSGHGAHDRRC